jgi:hypothetical protein
MARDVFITSPAFSSFRSAVFAFSQTHTLSRKRSRLVVRTLTEHICIGVVELNFFAIIINKAGRFTISFGELVFLFSINRGSIFGIHLTGLKLYFKLVWCSINMNNKVRVTRTAYAFTLAFFFIPFSDHFVEPSKSSTSL